jgi:uncharacterized membrane protein
MGFLQNRIAQGQRERETVKNNEAICDLQARTIGLLERQYAAGEISEREYRQRYGEYSKPLREMGR